MNAEDTAKGTSEIDSAVGESLWGRDEPLLWRWVAVGFLVIAALHSALVFGLLPFLPASATGVRIGLGVIPYLVGGLLLGLFPKQRSLLQPLYAALVPASLFSFIVEVGRVRAAASGDMGVLMSQVQWASVLAPILGYVLVTLATTWAADWIRHGRAHRSSTIPPEQV